MDHHLVDVARVPQLLSFVTRAVRVWLPVFQAQVPLFAIVTKLEKERRDIFIHFLLFCLPLDWRDTDAHSCLSILLLLHANEEIKFVAYPVGLMNFKESALMSDKRSFIALHL